MRRSVVVCFSFLSLVLAGGVSSVQAAIGGTCTNSIGMEFVLIPAGSFMREREIREGMNGLDRNGKAAMLTCRVSLGQPYYLGKYEVTQEQWAAVTGSNPARFPGRGHPVEQVSWFDAQAFIKRLNQREGTNRYRLPTDAEWEYAARAGTTTRYSFGDDENDLGYYAWYEGNSGGKTHSVGQKRPNSWGLYDMYGNVWEWVQDWYGKDFSRCEVAAESSDPSGSSYRVLRGGGWNHGAGFLRSSYRSTDSPVYRDEAVGFRLAFSGQETKDKGQETEKSIRCF